jgi:cyclophilin family peptidyl-prolyl cis-trans isomerase
VQTMCTPVASRPHAGTRSDPSDLAPRRIPLEIKVVGDKLPIYDDSLEDLGRFNDQPILPFNAYGTMSLARAEFDNNSGSSQIFFLLKESELTPSNANLLDGRYAVFGYVVQGQDYLGSMKVSRGHAADVHDAPLLWVCILVGALLAVVLTYLSFMHSWILSMWHMWPM